MGRRMLQRTLQLTQSGSIHMKRIYLLAAAAALASCHNRTDDQTGAAPKTADTTATHQIDPDRTGPPGTAGRPGQSTVNLDSTGVDTTKAVVDTSQGRAGGAVSTPQDTLGPRPASGDTTRADSSTAR
jgi:hypothetical protein